MWLLAHRYMVVRVVARWFRKDPKEKKTTQSKIRSLRKHNNTYVLNKPHDEVCLLPICNLQDSGLIGKVMKGWHTLMGLELKKEVYRLGGIIGECLAAETLANQKASLQTNGGGQDRA